MSDMPKTRAVYDLKDKKLLWTDEATGRLYDTDIEKDALRARIVKLEAALRGVCEACSCRGTNKVTLRLADPESDRTSVGECVNPCCKIARAALAAHGATL